MLSKGACGAGCMQNGATAGNMHGQGADQFVKDVEWDLVQEYKDEACFSGRFELIMAAEGDYGEIVRWHKILWFDYQREFNELWYELSER